VVLLLLIWISWSSLNFKWFFTTDLCLHNTFWNWELSCLSYWFYFLIKAKYILIMLANNSTRVTHLPCTGFCLWVCLYTIALFVGGFFFLPCFLSCRMYLIFSSRLSLCIGWRSLYFYIIFAGWEKKSYRFSIYIYEFGMFYNCLAKWMHQITC
jgi:hypothetical protein